MMTQLNRYLAGIFLQRLLITGFAMVTLLGVLDALGNAELLPEGAGMLGHLRYMGLRMPILFDRILMFAFLLALLLTYVTLIRRNELVAIAGAGISVFGQVRALIPAVVLASVLSAVLIDQVNPIAKQALEDWLGANVLREDDKMPQTLWLADDRFLVEVSGMEGEVLTGVTLFERGEGGRIAAVSQASGARFGPEGWSLSGVTQMRFDGQQIAAPQVWTSVQTPKTLRLLMSEPRDLALVDLLRLSRMTHSGSQPSSAYRVWFLNRLSLPFVAIGFLMLAVPMMQRFGRRDSG
ncbi:MAG: LptF/LptG family permease, partial [Paracoccaceae bacterium]|nr:LptF/LptG family permease [Paracoccaceae bacterium]